MTISNPRKILQIILITIVAAVIIGYTIFQSRNLIGGPKITIETPKNGSVVTDPLVEVKGIAKNTAELSLDDRPIFTDEQGAFDEHILVNSGYTIHKVTAKDKFGRVKNAYLELIFSGNAASASLTAGSSTPKTKASSTPAH